MIQVTVTAHKPKNEQANLGMLCRAEANLAKKIAGWTTHLHEV